MTPQTNESNLWQKFRLHYGEGGGKKAEHDYRMYCLGYNDAEARIKVLEEGLRDLLELGEGNCNPRSVVRVAKEALRKDGV